jgi:hypothetical protein
VTLRANQAVIAGLLLVYALVFVTDAATGLVAVTALLLGIFVTVVIAGGRLCD